MVRKQDLPRYKALGVVASIQPSHCIDDMRWAEKRIGRGPLPRRVQLPLLHGRRHPGGLRHRLVGGAARSAAGPLRRRDARATRRAARPGGWFPEEKIPLEDAIDLYTRGSAYAEFAENDKGTLEAGKLADLVVFAADLFRSPRARS